MKTLASFRPRIILGKNGDRPFFSSGELRHEISFLPSRELANVGLLHWRCAKHKPVYPVSVPSSVSLEPQVDLETADNQNQETSESKTVHVKFQLQKECSFGEQFIMVGDDPILGVWEPASAIPLNWSDEHVWTVDLDMPIGKSFQFKFILQGIVGKMLWQPGPNRILQTWETSNTIVVWEDWENAGLQKITEEEPSANQSEEVLVTNLNTRSVTTAVISDPEKEPLLETHEKPIIPDDNSPAQEELVAIVADNISSPDENPAVDVSDEVPVAIVEDNISSPDENPAIDVSDEVLRTNTSNKNTIMELDVLGNNGAPMVMNSASSDVQESIITHEGDPVLVPGLSPSSVITSEAETHNGGEGSPGLDASTGVDEIKNHNLPELSPENIQLDEKHEIDDSLYQEEKISGLNDEQLHYDEPINESLAEGEKQQQSEVIGDRVLENDLQWGRKTLQRLLTSFGLLKHQAE